MVPGMASYARSLHLALPLVALGLLSPHDVSAANAYATYRHLCFSVPAACTYTGPDAPELNANVCFGRKTGVRLMGTASCPSGSWPFYVSYGELVDPTTNEVAAYVPLDDACAKPGICVQGPPPPDAQEFPMCCTGNASGEETCYHGVSCGGQLYFCWDGVSNADGTVSCFEQWEV